ncbi:hypothetical protein [Azoarcus sp. DN11]|uniref:hypothetical protein n=1 Tax=Azoarcus sp. DN11 TaxID=356837 RepID=UPI000EB27E0F|nr:hypothetical protein [Azoarcus sp. DN11]AYH43958.1 hypothetical protein CDA09_11255 [Azoarcus sp. DN11]
MQNPIADLEDLSRTCNSVSMLVMDASAFERFFGRIYGAVNRFRVQPHNEQEATQLVETAAQLLEAAVNHHHSVSASATPNALRVYDETIRLLVHIMSTDLWMNDSVYEEAKKTRHALNALKACGINPPGHSEQHYSSRYGSGDANEAGRVEAWRYVRENIEEFTRFVYNLAYNHNFVPDPFWCGPQSAALSLFEKLKYLGSGASLIERQP